MRYLRALGLGALGLMPDAFRRMTFSDLMQICTARADWAAMADGKDPFKTAAQMREEIEELKEIAYGSK